MILILVRSCTLGKGRNRGVSRRRCCSPNSKTISSVPLVSGRRLLRIVRRRVLTHAGSPLSTSLSHTHSLSLRRATLLTRRCDAGSLRILLRRCLDGRVCWCSRFGPLSRTGHIPGGWWPLLQQGGPISYQPRPSATFPQAQILCVPLFCRRTSARPPSTGVYTCGVPSLSLSHTHTHTHTVSLCNATLLTRRLDAGLLRIILRRCLDGRIRMRGLTPES